MAQCASEQQFQDWEKLIDEGLPRFEAAKQVGTTLSALKRGDRVRFEQGVDLSLERQAAAAEKIVIEQTERPEPSAQVLIARIKATHPDYREKTQVEISGPEGGPIQLEGKAVVGLADVVAFAKRIGHGDLLGLDAGDSGVALPAAPEVLPDAGNGKRAAGVLPPPK